MIGVLNRKSPDQDDVAFVPLSTAKLRFLGSASGDAVAYIPAKTQSDEATAGPRQASRNCCGNAAAFRRARKTI